MIRADVIVIGAGLSGLTAARELTRRGRRVLILEKNSTAGGRLAVDEIEGARFDVGAQFFTVRNPAFRDFVRELEAEGAVREWFRGSVALHKRDAHDQYPRYRGAPDMTALAHALGAGIDTRMNCQVHRVSRDSRWVVETTNSASFEADWLVVTGPIPHILPTFHTGKVVLPHPILRSLTDMKYAPCLSLSVLLDGPSCVPEPGALQVDGEVLSWMADNHTKGVSPVKGAVTLHASGTWSEAHFDTSDEEVAAAMLNAATPWLGRGVRSWKLRRWSQAKPENPRNIGALGAEEMNLVFAGDAFSGAKVEGAVVSGFTAAKLVG